VTRSRLLAFAASLAALAACVPSEREDWHDQLVADSPCFRVNVLDGLDETSTTELRDLFACVDNGGQFDALSPTVDALEAESRDAVPAGIELTRTINALPDAGIDVFGLAGLAVDALQAEDRPIDAFMDLLLELAYGVKASRVRSGEVPYQSSSALQTGVLAPLAPVLQTSATVMLDDDLETAVFAASVLQDPETERWIRTFESTVASSDPWVHDPVANLLPHLGTAILAAQSPDNDHYSGTSGDSVRDLATAYAGSDPLIADLAPGAYAMLGDVVVRTRLESQLVEWYTLDHLEVLPDQVAWLGSVDVDGGALDPGEVSGLHALVRLLHDTNQPMVCSLDLWVTDLTVDLGNLATTILGVLADLDPDTVQTGVGILGTILGYDFSESVMHEIADTGICPVLTNQVVDDLGSIDLIYDERVYDLLVIFIEALDTLKNGESDHIADLADLTTTLYDGGGLEPVEELLRDIAYEPVLDDVIDLIPVLADPTAFGLTAGEQDPVDLQDALGLAIWFFEPDENGETGWDRLAPLVPPLLAEDGTWAALGSAGRLLSEEGSQTGRLLELLPPLFAIDPELTAIDLLAPLLGNEVVAAPVLRMIETEGVLAGLLATTPQGDDPDVPLAFVTRLVLDGTIDEVLSTVDAIMGAFADEP
jgi:hypothetical protein